MKTKGILITYGFEMAKKLNEIFSDVNFLP